MAEEKGIIVPQSTTPAADTSDWPLLLKNYDKRACPSFLLESAAPDAITSLTDKLPLQSS